MRTLILLFAIAFLTGTTIARPNTKDTLLEGIGNIVKNAVEPTTTQTPNVIGGALSGGEKFIKDQVSAHKDEIMQKVGDLAEKVGVNRNIAGMVGSNLLKEGIEKGKEFLSGHKAAEAVDKAKDEAKADDKLEKTFKETGTGSGEINSVDSMKVGERTNESGDIKEGEVDVEPIAIKKHVDLKKKP